MRRLLKVIFGILFLFILVYIGMVVKSLRAASEVEKYKYEKRSGTALVITGAAARIVQEAALLENLQKNGWLGNVCFISGTSSGALNTVMLNAILENKFSWNRYLSILFKLTNDDIFIRNGRALPVNNDPYRRLLACIINDSLGYNNLGDLPYQSSISVSDVDIMPPESKTYRLSNVKINTESNPGYNLVEALMASTAIPVIFPPARFSESFGLPNSAFVDGGLADDHLPYKAVLQYEKYRGYGVDTLIIISRKSDTKPDIDAELMDFGNNDSKLREKLGFRIENLARNGFIKSMKELQKEYPELAARTFVFIPEFPENFPLLDFNNLENQYNVTIEWANKNKPVSLTEFLAELDQKE